jgi:hypothetical protein
MHSSWRCCACRKSLLSKIQPEFNPVQMPPQGESVSVCLEDVVLFAELIKRNPSISYKELFLTQDSLRRERVEKLYEEASWGFNTQMDKSWVASLAMEYLTGLFLWAKKSEKEKNNMFDVRSLLKEGSEG